MPRDQRLYMTFPIDFWMHPKIAPLSDAAFRVFVEINGYSRMQDLDGRIPVAMAKKNWRSRAIAELLANHPERPSLSVDGDEYVIWNYDEHQLTRADRERLAEVSRTNGAKGGRPKRNPDETQPGSESNLGQTRAKAESESESESEIDKTDDKDSPKPVTEVDARDDDQSEIEFASDAAAALGIKNLPRVSLALRRAQIIEDELTYAEVVDLSRALLELSTDHVRYVEAYLERVFENSPHEVSEAWAKLPRPGRAAA